MIRPELLENIETPALIIDMDIVHANLKEYHDAVHSCGVDIRPHTKTHKIPELARLQIEQYGAKGIAVAKTSEAEVMADAGIDDIFVAYPIVGKGKIERLAVLNRKMDRLLVSFDSLFAAKQFSEIAVQFGKPFKIIADVDVVDMGRAGFKLETAVDEIMEASRLPGIEIIGVYAYAYMTVKGRKTASSPREAGVSEGQQIVEVAEELRKRGLNIEIVAGGSSPTGRWVATVPGITEVHPGGYIFNDQLSRFFGITQKDCAASVLTTVTSKHDWRITTDCGTKSLSCDIKESGNPGLPLDGGDGWIIDHPDLKVVSMSEEHTVIVKKDYDIEEAKKSGNYPGPGGVHTGTVTELELGDKIRIIPNHVCPCVALYDYCYFVENDKVRKVAIPNRGKFI